MKTRLWAAGAITVLAVLAVGPSIAFPGGSTSSTWTEAPGAALSIDPAAFASMEGTTVADVMARIAVGHGLSPKPTVSTGTLNGKTYTTVGSSPMRLDKAEFVSPPATATKRTKGHLSIQWSEISKGKIAQTSLPDPVAQFLAAYPGTTRADAIAFFGGDPAAQYGIALADGTVIGPTGGLDASGKPIPATTPAVGQGPIIQGNCVPNSSANPSYVHYYACWRTYLDQGSQTTTAPWVVSEIFKGTFGVSGNGCSPIFCPPRIPTQGDEWMYHQPSTVNFIPDWEPGSPKNSGTGCGSFNLGVGYGAVSTGVTVPVCDGYIINNGPRIYSPDSAHAPGPLFGPIWRGNVLTASQRDYEVNGIALVHTDGRHYGGKVFRFTEEWRN